MVGKVYAHVLSPRGRALPHHALEGLLDDLFQCKLFHIQTVQRCRDLRLAISKNRQCRRRFAGLILGDDCDSTGKRLGVAGGELTLAVTPKNQEPYFKTIHLTRAHLEEDAGKSVHGIVAGHSGIDLNRAGTPLLEIVTEPELRSSDEAVGYARTLHALVVWLGISEGNMQEGNFRCDANVSVRPLGQKEFGTRCEIKNLNSFRFLQEAIDFEVQRQIALIEDGGEVIQATRLFDPDSGETRLMRTKEDSMDYRYFPDPDLLPLEISDEWINRVREQMPELPEQMRRRLVEGYGLSEYDASILTASRDIARYYDALAQMTSDKKLAANWVMGEVSAAVKQTEGITFENSKVSPSALCGLLKRIKDGTLSGKGAKTVFAALWSGEGDDVDALIEAKGLKQISDASALAVVIEEVLAKNQKSVGEFLSGKEKALNALVGQCMKATKGKANPSQLKEMLIQKIKG